jgi:GTPase SAR1 family protein
LLAASAPKGDYNIRLWRLDVDVLLGEEARTESVEYANAKVVLVGNSGVGKSGLALVLRGEPFEPTLSTHARHVWMFQSEEVEIGEGRRQTREVMLWDLAGQPGYRVYHQLHLHEVAVALVLFDASDEINPFAGVAYWARALDEATRGFPLVKFLVAARIDRGSPFASRERIETIKQRYGFADYIATSALRGDGVEELKQALCQAVRWDQIAPISAPEVFYDVKRFLAQEKESGAVLRTREELQERYRQTSDKTVDSALLDACISRLEAAGLARPLVFGGCILLQPELLDTYCAWLAQAAREEKDDLGYIPEQQAREGSFPMDTDRPLAARPGDERTLLVAMVEEVVARRIAWRQQTPMGAMLVFPSELRADMPDYPGDYTRMLAYRFEGPVRAIYATLAVSLLNSNAFTRHGLYRNAATFNATEKQVCGFAVDYPDLDNDALGRLTVFFDAETSSDTKKLFLRYVDRQLNELALKDSLQRERIYQCSSPKCNRRQVSRDVIEDALAAKDTYVFCQRCGTKLFLDDLVEESTRSDERVEEVVMQSQEEQEKQQRLVTVDEREKSEQFDVFLSHNSKDEPEVRDLAKRLRAEGLLPWLDKERILAGDQFVPELEPAMQVIPVALVLIGPNSQGRWQAQEYYVLLQRFVEHRKQSGTKRLILIPVLLPGAPEEPEVPPFLGTFNRVDFRERGFDDRDEFRRLLRGILTPRDR